MYTNPSLISPLAGVIIAYIIYRQFLLLLRRRPPLPPGPRGYPFIGNFWDIATNHDLSWIRYWKWSKIYGEIVHLEVLGQHTIVLNSRKALVELLDNRSHNYSDRPDMPMAMGLVRMGYILFAFFRYSDSWKLYRKTFHQGFQPRVLPEYYDIQRTATASLMDKLAISPGNFVDHIQHWSGSIILKIVYGYSLQDTADDAYMRLVHNAVEGVIQASSHGSFWIDYFPLLRYVPGWLPGAGFKRKAKRWRQFNKELKDEPWTWVKRAVEDGTAVPSFCTRSAERLSVTPGDGSSEEEMIKICAANAYIGGADTTVSSIATFILAMTLHPEFQVRAQQEIDAVIRDGTGRVPDFEDRDKFPFVDAILKEVARWNPVTPTAAPHRAVQDDVYEGFFIPAGTTIVANAWAVLHDENVYGPNPMEFNPMRFMKPNEDGVLPPDSYDFAFGFGRRACPGKDFALDSIYLAVTSLLARFTITKALDDKGNEIVPEVEYDDGLMSHPKPFKCRFIPRTRKPVAKDD
ncbi:hypothetical protein PQX77_006073 [Marasmius sp. AFHP31]|nr:hypothetical protein PQX77_006073 [Marasmius sp. AFHP31]